MPTNTPLPAAEFRRITDEIERIAFKLVGGANSQDEIALDHILSTYRAARAASPRTLEEVLMIKERQAHRRAGCGFDPDMVADWEIATSALAEHARRLAGEGGGE